MRKDDIIMKNSEKYFNGVTGFIEDMAEINSKYEKAVKRLEPFKGSEGYNQEMQAVQAQRESDVRQMREIYLKQFRETAEKMREAVNCRPLVPPTPEQAALLNVLQMRQSLSRDELERAAQQMGGCSAALAVLDDLAQKHKVPGVRFNWDATADDLRGKIDTLERAALKLIQEGADAAKRRVPKDVTSCMERYGCFQQVSRKGASVYGGITNCDMEMDTQTITAFCEAVNG